MVFTKAQRIKGLKKQLKNLGIGAGDVVDDEPTAATQDDELTISLEGMEDW